MRFKSETKYTVGLIIGFILLVGTGMFTLVSITNLVGDSRLVNHTHEVLENLEDILSQLKDTETGQRGFVLTGDTVYLEPFDAGLVGVEVAVAKVKALTSDNLHQQRHIEEIELLIQTKVDELEKTIRLRRDLGFSEALEVILTSEGKNTMDQVRAVIADMKQIEVDLLESRALTTLSTAARTKLAVISGTMISIFIFGLIAVVLIRSSSKAKAELQERIAIDAHRQELILELVGKN
jgi:CHASE3 domain sensor protein